MRSKISCLNILSVSILFFSIICGSNGMSGSNGEIYAAKKRPNFLFILTDDQSPETLSVYGNKVCNTPNIDKLAARGMTFDDAHHMGSWVGAVCTASRTMIMTGRTLWNAPGARGPGIKFPKDFRQQAAEQSLPAVFNRAGYDTYRTCKNGNSFKEANAIFDESDTATMRQGTADNGSRWHGDKVIDYLNRRAARKDQDPFLIYFGFSHPHDPRNATPKLAEKYGVSNDGPSGKPNPKAPPLRSNYLPAHPFPHGHPGLRDEVAVQGVMKNRDEATVRNELGREYACIENIDSQVGRVISRLRKMGELENTYIIFTSDHGIAVGRHGLMGKQNLYEHTWRVPFIVSGPGIKPGSRASGYCYLLDVLPTFCDLADIKIPDVVDGKSFRPILEGKVDRIRDSVYGVYCGGTKPGMRSIKTDGWKLIEYDVLDGKVRETQLFNLKENPFEYLAEHHDPQLVKLLKHQPAPNQIDLAELPEYAAKRKELENLLAAEMKRLGDPYTLSKNRVPATRFESSIQQFEKQDKNSPPCKGGILFTGSSSIRMWDTITSFPNREVLNRGFGGSQISDVLYYFDRVVLKYEPSVIVFYCGDNDIANQKSPEQVFNDYQTFSEKVHAAFPETEIIYLPIKPSKARWNMWQEMSKANQKIRTLSESKKYLHYCDIVPAMLNDKGIPNENYLIGDGLHLNKTGYKIWTDLVEKELKKLD